MDNIQNSSNLIKTWFLELRVPFFTATIIPVVLGVTLAWYYEQTFDGLLFVLTIIGTICLHSGTNLINDFFDYKSGGDAINVEAIRPYTGGSMLIQQNLISATNVYHASILFFIVGGVIGLILAFLRGLTLLWFIVFAIVAGYSYTKYLAPNLIGELITGLCFGPLMVLGTYYVQTQTFSFIPIVASIPVAILIISVIWINEIPDYTADKTVLKTTLVVRLGKQRSANIYSILLPSAYLVLLVEIWFGLLPITTFIAFIPLSLMIKAITNARRHYGDSKKLGLSNALTVKLHLYIGILLILGIFLDLLLKIL